MTITLLCTKSVIMLVSNDVAFVEGQEYSFFSHFDGSVSRVSENGVHSFRKDAWPTYFKYELVQESV